ncbi:MAG TPA: hypothetical protein VJ023_18980 [Pyrinomonadaceae bacterium]|nr:hypothetical protein [Pyrinomonadaceae bacterium]
MSDEAEIRQLARIWYEGWREAHEDIVPVELTRVRTLESFSERLETALPNVRVVGPAGDPVGFSIVKVDELYQLFVSAQSRGSGVPKLSRDHRARVNSCDLVDRLFVAEQRLRNSRETWA